MSNGDSFIYINREIRQKTAHRLNSLVGAKKKVSASCTDRLISFVVMEKSLATEQIYKHMQFTDCIPMKDRITNTMWERLRIESMAILKAANQVNRAAYEL